VKPLGGQWGAGQKEKGREASDGSEVVGGGGKAGERLEGMEQVLAAVGFPSVPPPARMAVLSDDLFKEPPGVPVGKFGDVIPRVGNGVESRSGSGSGGRGQGPLMKLPYPFTRREAQVSSKDQVPFPPSPGGVRRRLAREWKLGRRTGKRRRTGQRGKRGK
jgi:hypothetical protein